MVDPEKFGTAKTAQKIHEALEDQCCDWWTRLLVGDRDFVSF
jgi:hypothetical protein